jgi:hypothetical protein
MPTKFWRGTLHERDSCKNNRHAEYVAIVKLKLVTQLMTGNTLDISVGRVALLLRIKMVSGSNFSPETRNPDTFLVAFSLCLKVQPGIVFSP